MGAGRPSIYSEELSNKICERLANGESLNKICKDDEMPDISTVKDWIIQDREGFAPKYTRAREAQLDLMAEEVLAIADEPPERTEHGVDSGSIANKRIRFDARRWYLSKLAPKKYGEKLEIAGDPNNPIITQRNYSADDIETLKAYFEATKLPKLSETLTIEHKADKAEDDE